MKLRHACALGLALCLVGGTASRAQDMDSGTFGPYVRGEAGWNHLEDMSAHGSTGGLQASDTYNEGYIFGGALGYGWGPLRLELGLDYRHNSVDKVNVGNVGAFGGTRGSFNGGGSVTSVIGMVNGLYDLPWRTSMVPGLVPYIGAGVGLAGLNFNSVKAGSVKVIDDSDTVPAIQAIAGLRYNLNDNWGLGLEYRFLNGFHPNLKDTTGNRLSTSDYRTHSILLSVTYMFGVAPPPPPPTPAAAPAPAPAAAATTVAKQVFLVFFDFDRSTLTPAGRQVVEAAANAYKSDKSVHIDLTGYTDLAGTQKYNLGLSKRRAETVSSYLVKLGVPASALDVAWRGKENPRVPTPDGVREPQNRRVEIDFK